MNLSAMAESRQFYLVARCGELRLAIPVALLREVLEADSVAWTEGDSCLGGLIVWQGRSLFAQPLSQLPGWRQSHEGHCRHLLVVEADRALHGLLVDDIVGIFPAEGFILHDVPEILRSPDLLYGRLAVRNAEVMVVCGRNFFAGFAEAGGST
ncbi:MAG: chemotaxis protein CheW [Deltaproteobacteria bacterium]|nr:MAG: chemotaxis protein CheW [Deltaproteobacteria bacterium]